MQKSAIASMNPQGYIIPYNNEYSLIATAKHEGTIRLQLFKHFGTKGCSDD